jgi:thiol-disulfide isomerase/thioredoxin
MSINSQIQSARRIVGVRFRNTLLTATVLGVCVAAPGRVHAQESALTNGMMAPGAMVETLDGKPVDIASYLSAKKPVVLEFWATWCPLCKALEPAMAAAHAKYEGRVTFVSVGVPANQSPEKQRDYVAAHKLGGEFVFDRDSKAIGAYKANHTSYMVVVDATGHVVYTGSGAEQDVDAAVMKAFAMEK